MLRPNALLRPSRRMGTGRGSRSHCHFCAVTAVDFEHSSLGEETLRMRALARQALSAIVPLGVLAFWAGMSAAGRSYPLEYDWRYTTISSLVYPDRNPSGYLWARGGMLLCALAGLYWTAVLVRRAKQSGVARRPIGIWVLGLGYLCMMCCALLPEQRLGIPRGHDLLALAAFVGICAGTVHSSYKVVERSAWVGKLPGSPRLHASIVAGVALSPIALAALAQTYVSHALPALPWVNLTWRARGVPVYLSFAFCEWVACAVFSVYTVVVSRATLAARCV
jgi:hypothetical protein